jgi:Cation transporter/ATPase, N-terminus
MSTVTPPLGRHDGLSQKDAEARLLRFGPNSLPAAPPDRGNVPSAFGIHIQRRPPLCVVQMPGTTKLERRKENIGAAKIEFGEADLRRIESVLVRHDPRRTILGNIPRFGPVGGRPRCGSHGGSFQRSPFTKTRVLAVVASIGDRRPRAGRDSGPTP